MKLKTTPSQTVGPYFAINLTRTRCRVREIAGPQAKGERVVLICRVLDGDSVGVPDAMIELWQADADGVYNHPDDSRQKAADTACGGFGRMGTSEDGTCEFETVKPGRIPGPNGTYQAPHVNVAVFARGMLRQLYTRIYFAGDPTNEQDPVLALVPRERRESLMAQPDPARNGTWRFDIRLQGENETVFFDV
jgi:protocatechuate 3,4-dioxygenase alpha subunit